MTNTDQKQENEVRRETPSKPHKIEEESIELRPDGDERFRKAVRAAAKVGPLHRPSKSG